MTKQIIFLLVAFLAVQVKTTAISPRDLADEVIKQVDDLEATVGGNILAAHSELSDDEYDFLSSNDNVLTNGAISIQQEEQAILEELTTVKDLANNIAIDISACTDIREEVLRRLPGEYISQMRTCVFSHNREEAQLITDARYIIDVSINKVHNTRFRVNQCGGDILCLSPLVTEIELDKIRLPQNIKTEVQAFEAFLTGLQLLVQECSDSKMAEYTADAWSLFGDISACVDRILS